MFPPLTNGGPSSDPVHQSLNLKNVWPASTNTVLQLRDQVVEVEINIARYIMPVILQECWSSGSITQFCEEQQCRFGVPR